MNTKELVLNQREFFNSGKTLDVNFRLENLKKLKINIQNMEEEIKEALKLDLNKPFIESLMCEISLCYKEIDYFLKNLKKLVKPKKVKGTLENFPSKSYSYFVPYGVTLIMSPWNYPFLLSIQPLIDSIASGNTCILKVVSYSQNTSKVIKKLIEKTFEKNYVYCLEGDRNVNQDLLSNQFDYIFFTGGKNVGKIVLKSASEFLTPVTLELGGKSPCIVSKTADLELSAKRICFGKFLNAGQTCVAPDYILIDESIKENFLNLFIEKIKTQFTNSPIENDDYGKIINQKHFDRLSHLLQNQNIVYGGKKDVKKLKIEPTIVEINNLDNQLMQEEIFGPIIPIITYEKEEEIFSVINQNPNPLALYFFGYDKKLENSLMLNVGFGGGCVNDCIMHLVSNMSFGGFKDSGMGSYHKQYGFYTFSHKKNILVKNSKLDIDLRYRPYTNKKIKMIEDFLK